MTTDPLSTYEASQPWVLYHYGLTHDLWWPPWNSTRVLGRARMILECMVCGDRSRVSIKIPRFGPVIDEGPHPKRLRYLAKHRHPDRGHPMSWAKPLANMAAHPDGLDLDQLAFRVEVDLNASLSELSESTESTESTELSESEPTDG